MKYTVSKFSDLFSNTTFLLWRFIYLSLVKTQIAKGGGRLIFDAANELNSKHLLKKSFHAQGLNVWRGRGLAESGLRSGGRGRGPKVLPRRRAFKISPGSNPEPSLRLNIRNIYLYKMMSCCKYFIGSTQVSMSPGTPLNLAQFGKHPKKKRWHNQLSHPLVRNLKYFGAAMIIWYTSK